jgi:uncharacterized phage protein gp47/JayE
MSSSCACCAPEAPRTPITLANRPGLSAIAYRIGTYATFRQRMLDGIAGTPELANLTTRNSDDYSVTFMELWAALLDVLTFYQERYANEVFLRTAQQAQSLRRLARLLDYSPRPGVAALADLAFTLDPGKTVQVPIGLRVQSVPAQNQQPQNYETMEAVALDARFNRLRIYPQPMAAAPMQFNSSGEILDKASGPSLYAALAVNDPVVLFNDGGTDPAEEKKIKALTIQDDAVFLSWTKPVQGKNWSAASKAFKYRRNFRMFGYNAAPSFMQPTTSSAVPGGILWSQQQTDFSNSGGNTLPLDSRYSDLATGTQLLVVFQPLPPPPPPPPGPPPLPFPFPFPFPIFFGSAFQAELSSSLATSSIQSKAKSLSALNSLQTNLVTVTQVSQVPASSGVQGQPGGQGAMSDTVTQVTIDPPLPAMNDIRNTIVFELVGDEIKFWGNAYQRQINTATAYLSGRFVQSGPDVAIEVGLSVQKGAFGAGVVIAPNDLAAARRVILMDASDTPVDASVQGAAQFDTSTPTSGTFGHLVIPLQADSIALDAGSAVLLGNVVRASNGQTVSKEVLGSGNAAQAFQSFLLQKQPLTYVPSSNTGGVSSSLQLSVNSVQWTEVPELFGQPFTAQVFSSRQNEDGKTLIQFGDANFGATIPTGKSNVVATYRYGSGVGGDVAANSLTTLLDRLQGLTTVTNPLPAEGGADPETMGEIRGNAPRTVRTFDRIVSLLDFQDLITASGEVAKALATWIWDGYGPAVHLTVAGQNGGTFSDLTNLGATLSNARDPNHRLLLDNYSKVPVLLAAKLWIQSSYALADVIAAATQAVLAALSFDQLTLGASLHLSQIYEILQNVDGVLGADVSNFGFKIPAGLNPTSYLQSRGVTFLAGGVVAPVQDFLRIFGARPDTSHPGRVLPAELAIVDVPSTDVTITAES